MELRVAFFSRSFSVCQGQRGSPCPRRWEDFCYLRASNFRASTDLVPQKISALLERNGQPQQCQGWSYSFVGSQGHLERRKLPGCALQRTCLAFWVFPRISREVFEMWAKVFSWEWVRWFGLNLLTLLENWRDSERQKKGIHL